MFKCENARVGSERLREGRKLLYDYRRGRADIESRIISDEAFWNSRHLPTPLSRSSDMPVPASAWLFSAIVNKHSDMMESIPTPVCLAREQSDTSAAQTLNAVLPVIYDRIGFKRIYSDAAYDKLKHGTAVYGVFWDPLAENGLGDIDIKRVDILRLYWEPGISELEDSSNIFYVSTVDRKMLEESYPEIELDKASSNAEYELFASVGDDKLVVIDWYYKKRYGTKSVLHYIKFTGDTLLYASENDESATCGFYRHGMYPFVFDVLYKESEAPCGYGMISISKGTQRYIDKLDENLLERSIMSAKPRYMIKKNVGIDKTEFADWSNTLIEVEGDLSDERIRSISLPTLDESILTVRESKIDEMREVAANRNVNYGGSDKLTSGVAIAAVQEAANKVARDIISGSWNAFTDVTRLVIELIREFYTESRCFRITQPNDGACDYISFAGSEIAEREIKLGENTFYRLPIFDIEVRAQRTSLFSRLTQNETIIELYRSGLFKRENIREAMIVLETLELEGKNRIIEDLKSLALSDATSDGACSSDASSSGKIGARLCKTAKAASLNEVGGLTL